MPRGGKREGAGRPPGTGRFGEPTARIRVPESKLDEVYAFLDRGNTYQRPLYSSRVSAGFPSPADEYMEGKLDLNTYLIDHPAATFFVKVSGESMIGAGIKPDDLLIVDRSLTPKNNDIVIAVVDTELTVKRLIQKSKMIKLLPENPAFKPLMITEDMDFSIWGVVTGSVTRF